MNTKTTKFLKEYDKLLQKYEVKQAPRIVFPGKDSIPLRGKLALWLLKGARAQIINAILDAGGAKKKHGNTTTSKHKLSR